MNVMWPSDHHHKNSSALTSNHKEAFCDDDANNRCCFPFFNNCLMYSNVDHLILGTMMDPTVLLLFVLLAVFSILSNSSYYCFRVGVIVFFPDVLKSLTDNEEFKKGVDSQKGLQGDPMKVWKNYMGLESKADDDDE